MAAVFALLFCVPGSGLDAGTGGMTKIPQEAEEWGLVAPTSTAPET